jgi:hypothetical protein
MAYEKCAQNLYMTLTEMYYVISISVTLSLFYTHLIKSQRCFMYHRIKNLLQNRRAVNSCVFKCVLCKQEGRL